MNFNKCQEKVTKFQLDLLETKTRKYYNIIE